MKNLNSILEKHARVMFSIFMISMSLFIVSCNDDDDDVEPPCENIVEVAQSAPDLSTLVSAIVAADLTSVLAEGGPFTVFAPTNEAFAKLDPQILNNIISTPSLLTALLQYHVVSGKVTSSQLSNGAVATLLSGQSIDVDISGGMVTLNGSSKVTTADIEACNGVIHIIDEVLLPEDFAPQTIVQIAASNPNFSILVSALSKPELSDLLTAANDPTSDLTVFAPTNDAFTAVLTALGKNSIDDLPVGLLKEIVQYHIVAGATMSTELTNGLLPTLLPNENLTVDVSNGVMINDSEVILADVKAINGVIHAIDGVLLPSYASAAVGTISEVIVFDPDYTILVAALQKAELLETVSTADNLTLFAPDNAAFVAAGITSLDGLDKDALTPVLLYHVLGAKVLSTELPADGMVTTLSSDQMMYLGYLNDGVVLINGLTKITAVDIEKSNG
ncbi:MAG: fasciclin domain-containing protein, partial [Bacteroidetes bacterium]|nr:fasciclin domain-containing protein [Bacteroidota bacterium]